jgi:hypothetical protein
VTYPALDIALSLPPDNRLRVGIVTGTGPTVVEVQGTEINAGVLSSYTPVVGDNVAVLRCQSSWLVLGKVV